MRYFEDFSVGENGTHGPRPVPREEIIAFASEFDPQSFHLDEDAELAVMVDTFRPLLMTEHAVAIEDANYYLSWTENGSPKGEILMSNITS